MNQQLFRGQPAPPAALAVSPRSGTERFRSEETEKSCFAINTYNDFPVPLLSNTTTTERLYGKLQQTDGRRSHQAKAPAKVSDFESVPTATAAGHTGSCAILSIPVL